MNIREIIVAKSNMLRDVAELGPGKASEELVELASLLSSLNAEIADKQWIFNTKKQMCLDEHKSAAKAKIYAEASQEWKDYIDRVMQKEAVEELLRAVKYYLRSAEAEYREFSK